MADQFTSAHWTPDEIAAATGGYWINGPADWSANGVTAYKGTVKPGNLVIIPDGANWSKGYEEHRRPDYAQLKKAGAVAVMTSDPPAEMPADLPVLRVEATFRALGRIAVYARDRFDGTMIAITGSVGKTTTKTFLSAILSRHGRVFAKTGNWNGRFAIRRVLSLIPPDVDYVIQECGMGRPGSIRPRARLVRPDIAIITHILDDHMEFHGSLESIARTKAALFEFLPEDGVAIINRDANHYDILRAAAGNHRTLTYGEHDTSDVRLIDRTATPRGSDVVADVLGKRVSYTLGTPGLHLVPNSLAVLAVIAALGLDIEDAAADMRTLAPAPRRSQLAEVALPGGRLTIIDDTYNANPASMRASLGLLGLFTPDPGGRRIAVLGAMAELGRDSKRYHEELADAVMNADADLVITTGEDMKSLRDALPSHILGPHVDELRDMRRVVLKTVRAGDLITVKGSARGKSLRRIVNALRRLDTTEAKAEPPVAASSPVENTEV